MNQVACRSTVSIGGFSARLMNFSLYSNTSASSRHTSKLFCGDHSDFSEKSTPHGYIIVQSSQSLTARHDMAASALADGCLVCLRKDLDETVGKADPATSSR